jgi:hypothetical protein
MESQLAVQTGKIVPKWGRFSAAIQLAAFWSRLARGSCS